MFDFLKSDKKLPAINPVGVDVQTDEGTDRSLGKMLAASLDIRTRIEVERDGIELRLGKLKSEASTIRQNIANKSADLAELDRIIAGMEAHLRVITEGAAKAEGAGE